MRTRLLFKFISSLLISHFIIMIGKSDWIGVFADWYYYKDLAITFLSVFIVFEYVDRITRYLNGKYRWRSDLLRRAFFQITLVVIVPCFMAILLTFLQYEFIYDQNLFETGYFQYEFPATILLVVIVNLVFVISYLIKSPIENLRDDPDGVNERIAEPGVPVAGIVLSKKGSNNVPVAFAQIAYIRLRNGVPFLTSHSGDVTLLQENMDHYERILPTTEFFRVNRQAIINRSSCKSFKAIENGKIEVLLQPDYQAPLIVSQKRASKFRTWVKG